MPKRATDSIPSGRALARALGVGEATIREYLGRPDWPVRRRGPWSRADVTKVQAWRRSLQEDRAADDEDEAGVRRGDDRASQVNIGLKAEKLLHERLKRRKLEGSLVDRQLLDRALEGLARMFAGTLDELERSLPFQLQGQSAGEIERRIADRIRAARAQLAGQTVIELQQVQQQIVAANQPKARGRPANRA